MHIVGMTLTIVEEPPTRLAEYAQVPIGFAVAEMFDDQGLAALRRDASAQPVAVVPAYWKDYDSYPGGHPSAWQHRFDLSRWNILAAFDGTRFYHRHGFLLERAVPGAYAELPSETQLLWRKPLNSHA